jgi:hypothetical protein
LTEKGSTQESVDTYKRLLSRQGGYFPPANLELGFALISLKQYDEAMGNLQMVANRDGAQYPSSYYHLARVFELEVISNRRKSSSRRQYQRSELATVSFF